MSAKDGGSAFPKYFGGNRDLAPGEEAGMSLRDYFAAHALVMFADPQVLLELRNEARKRDVTESRLIGDAVYEVADAMLRAREKEPHE